MKEFENEKISAEETDTATDANKSEVQEKREGVNFNADGTYHGVHENNENDNSNNASSVNNDYNNNYQRSAAYGNNTYNNNYNNYRQPGAPGTGAPGTGAPGTGAYSYNQNTSYNGYNPNFVNPSEKGYAYPETGDNKKKGSGKSAKVLGIIVGILCVALAVLMVMLITGDDNKKEPAAKPGEEVSDNVSENVEEYQTQASPETGGTASSDGEMTPKNIYKSVLPSSVGILVYTNSKTLASEGSGVLFQESEDGKYTYILTCAHVIQESSGKIRVQTYDSEEYDAEVVGFDARTDIGVIRVEKTGFKLAEIGDSTQISVGDPIYAIGNPGGVEFANSFTNGIVSALDRPVNSSLTSYTTECIQHTAAINPGNSGGALVNAFGQVVGINSMKIVADDYEGMGFAVPSSVFVDIVNDIMENGYVANRPKLGITYVPASEYNDYGMFVAIKELPSGSIVIYSIAEDSALASTEAKEGDMIISVNGTPLDDPSYLSELIEDSDVGDTITLGIIRINDDYSFEEFDVSVTLVEDRGDTFVQEDEAENSGSPDVPGNGGSYDDYEDYFNKFFEDYFGSSFGDGFGGFAP